MHSDLRSHHQYLKFVSSGTVEQASHRLITPYLEPPLLKRKAPPPEISSRFGDNAPCVSQGKPPNPDSLSPQSLIRRIISSFSPLILGSARATRINSWRQFPEDVQVLGNIRRSLLDISLWHITCRSQAGRIHVYMDIQETWRMSS